MNENIAKYQTVMTWARALLDKEVITKAEYNKIDTMTLKKYDVSSCSIYR